MFAEVYNGRRVLITGNTGFKGSWLTAWLLSLGAEVAGYSHDVPTEPSHFEVLKLRKKIAFYEGDVRDREGLKKVIEEFRPDIIFHLAAQALVRTSYIDPVTTFETNAIGTLNVLECLRNYPSIAAAVIVTSDKAYRNMEWEWGYREIDTLGGEDPYSSSKGCAELISYSYMNTYFRESDTAYVATARAGNVIGGGDWATDRIIPDCIRAWAKQETLQIRSPNATRPWQHVLEPLSGYLWLGAQLFLKNDRASCESYNFGPDSSVNQTVESVIQSLGKYWENAKYKVEPGNQQFPEAGLLKLSCEKALAELQWQATLGFSDTIAFTSKWYQSFYEEKDTVMWDCTLSQIADYTSMAVTKNVPWTNG